MYRARNTNEMQKTMDAIGHDGNLIIVFDTETTGLDTANDSIVELAAKKYQAERGRLKKLEELNIYIKPPLPMPDQVISIHGITNEFLSDKPNEEYAFPDIAAFFDGVSILCGHNVWFDIGMMKALYGRNGYVFQAKTVLDTLEMARDLLTAKEIKEDLLASGVSKSAIDKKEVGIYTLGTLTKLYHLEEDITFHNALDDTEACARLLETFFHEYEMLPDDNGKPPIHYQYFYYWKGMNKEQSGLYVVVDPVYEDLNNKAVLRLRKKNPDRKTTIYYSTYQKAWLSSTVDLSRYDIDALEYSILKRMGITYRELGKLTAKKYEAIKERMYAKR